MRILRVAQTVYPDVKGGGAYHVHAMSRDQAAMGHDITVLTVGDGDPISERAGYTVIRQPMALSLLGNDISPGIAQFLRGADDFDVIHAHSHLYFSTNIAAFARVFNETPLAITNHGLYSQTVPEWLFDLYLRTAGKWTFNAADTVFTYTDEERDQLQARGVTSPIAVVHNGIDTERFSPNGCEYTGLIGNPSLLFVGRFVEGKRPGDALAAFAQIRANFPNAGLTFCGKGPLREELEQETRRLGIEDTVTFLGHIPYDTMPDVYRASDLLILPSRTEGVPRTVLESLSSGCPVVTSNLPHLQSLVTQAGETVPVGDTDGFATALQDLLGDDDQRQQLGRQGRRNVVENYAWEETVAKTTERLKGLMRQ